MPLHFAVGQLGVSCSQELTSVMLVLVDSSDLCIKRQCCLTSDCLTYVVYIGPKTRKERSSKTKIGTEVADVTSDSDNTFTVKGQGHKDVLVVSSSRPIWTLS